jgi:DNA replication protein DnaC
MKETEAITTEYRVCRRCKSEYTANIVDMLGVRHVLGDGYCRKCVDNNLVKEEEKTKGEIITQRRQWRESCGIPRKFMNEDFSTFRMGRDKTIDNAFKECIKYAEGYPLNSPHGYRSLMLASYNAWGVGKTHLVCAIGHRVLDRWNGEEIVLPVRFISEPDIYRMIQDTYSNENDSSEQSIIRGLVGARLLIIDDIGKERRVRPDFVQRIMYSIINGRYGYELPTVMTTNLTQNQLKLYLGGGLKDEATFDRIIEMVGGQFIILEGESYRRANQ